MVFGLLGVSFLENKVKMRKEILGLLGSSELLADLGLNSIVYQVKRQGFVVESPVLYCHALSRVNVAEIVVKVLFLALTEQFSVVFGLLGVSFLKNKLV